MGWGGWKPAWNSNQSDPAAGERAGELIHQLPPFWVPTDPGRGPLSGAVLPAAFAVNSSGQRKPLGPHADAGG